MADYNVHTTHKSQTPTEQPATAKHQPHQPVAHTQQSMSHHSAHSAPMATVHPPMAHGNHVTPEVHQAKSDGAGNGAAEHNQQGHHAAHSVDHTDHELLYRNRFWV